MVKRQSYQYNGDLRPRRRRTDKKYCGGGERSVATLRARADANEKSEAEGCDDDGEKDDEVERLENVETLENVNCALVSEGDR